MIRVRKTDLSINAFFAFCFVAGLVGKIGIKTAGKAAAKTGAKVTVKTGSKVGLKAGVAIGAGSLYGLSNVFTGDGPLGFLGDVLGLEGVSSTFTTIIIVIVGIVILIVVFKFLIRRR